MSRPGRSPEVNPRFTREETPRLDASKTALGVAPNFGSTLDPNRLPLQPLKALAVSVPTAARILGVGTTTMWGLVGSGSEVEVLRIGRRTLVTMASLERLVASGSAPSRQRRETRHEVHGHVCWPAAARDLGSSPGPESEACRRPDRPRARNRRRPRSVRSRRPLLFGDLRSLFPPIQVPIDSPVARYREVISGSTRIRDDLSWNLFRSESLSRRISSACTNGSGRACIVIGFAGSLLIGSTEAKWDSATRSWVLHVHVLAIGVAPAAWKRLKKALRGAGPKFPVKVQPLRNPERQVSYMIKFHTFFRPRSRNGEVRSPTVPLPPDRLAELANWWSGYTFEDFTFLFGARRRGGEIVPEV